MVSVIPKNLHSRPTHFFLNSVKQLLYGLHSSICQVKQITTFVKRIQAIPRHVSIIIIFLVAKFLNGFAIAKFYIVKFLDQFKVLPIAETP